MHFRKVIFKSEKEKGKRERERKLGDKLGGICSRLRRSEFNGNPKFLVEAKLVR